MRPQRRRRRFSRLLQTSSEHEDKVIIKVKGFAQKKRHPQEKAEARLIWK
jgi:hypothetical protein